MKIFVFFNFFPYHFIFYIQLEQKIPNHPPGTHKYPTDKGIADAAKKQKKQKPTALQKEIERAGGSTMTTPTLALKRETRFKYSPGLHCGLHVYHFEADFSAALPQSVMSC